MKFEEIIAEIRNGRWVKRPVWPVWRTISESAVGSFRINTLTREDILSEDWELEPLPEKKIEVTKKTIIDAWNEAKLKDPKASIVAPKLESFLLELGLFE